LNPSRAETGHFYPQFLEDGKHFLYTAASSRPEHQVIRIRSLESGEDRVLVNGRANAEISAGHLLFWGGNSLMVQPFDERRLQLRGEARPLTDAVRFDSTFPFSVQFSAFRERLLAYRTFQPEQTTRLVWYDRQGKQLGTIGEPALYSNPALSPEGRRLAIGIADPKTGFRDLWTFDLVRGSRSRLTFDPADESNPVWSPDGSQIAFSSSRRGGRDIYLTRANQGGEETPVSESSQVKYLEEWSADGRWLFFHNLDDIYRIPATGVDAKPERVVARLGMQERAHLSPNREWLAYTSDESGRLEIYVQAMRPQGGRFQISTEGGTESFWRADGKELFFIKESALMAVDVKEGPSSLIAGVPKRLFEAPLTPVTFRRNRYVVTADGKRFLIITSAEAHQPERITVVVNWTGLLKR